MDFRDSSDSFGRFTELCPDFPLSKSVPPTHSLRGRFHGKPLSVCVSLSLSLSLSLFLSFFLCFRDFRED